MDFVFSDEQRQLQESIRSFMMTEISPELLRELWDTDSGRSDAIYGKLARQGITGLSVPVDAGGLGGGELDWILMNRELGYYAVPDSLYLTAQLAVGLLNGLPEQSKIRKEWLPKVAYGEARIAVGHPVNPFIADAHCAHLLLLHHDGEVHAVKPSSVKVTLNPSLDPSRRLYTVDWAPSVKTRIADGATGAALWDDMLERGTLATAAQLLGLSQRMLDLSVDYAAQRRQFGKPIGSFQAIKHQLSNVALKIEFAKPVAYRAAYALAHRQPNREVFASHAKLAAAEASWLAARSSIQIHGAYGYTWDADLQIFAKRAWVLDAAWGNRSFHKARIADGLLRGKQPAGPGHTF